MKRNTYKGSLAMTRKSLNQCFWSRNHMYNSYTNICVCVCIVLSSNENILSPIVYNSTGILSHAGNVAFFDYWLTNKV